MNNSSGDGLLLGGRAEQQNWSEKGTGLFPLLGSVLSCSCESRCGLVFVYDRSYDAEEERSGIPKGNVRRGFFFEKSHCSRTLDESSSRDGFFTREHNNNESISEREESIYHRWTREVQVSPMDARSARYWLVARSENHSFQNVLLKRKKKV